MEKDWYTENFMIDPLIPADANQLYQFMVDNTDRLKYYLPVTLANNATLEKTIAYIATKNKEIEEKINFTFAIRNRITNEIAGLIIIKKIDWANKQGEFANCIGLHEEGKGLTSYAVKERITFAFSELELKTLQIIAHKSNLGSVKVAKNNGFIWQKTMVNEFTPTNQAPLDMELYELTR
ncbi:ribosomal-protein-alanine N-acetyltransferase [Flavobacterium xanthum]|uniref:Ribosomal-protein-alanine N-acetyltransferase n=2 Tax=Flavobacteriaceae TaxID=49546 RepID=A0A1M7E849_9FLAO|nr:ribosomal-protein-alanine N-acetyltransferase [Flavobacterium xanthum]